MKPSPVLEVNDLAVQYDTDEGLVEAVRGVSFQVAPGQTLGIVGESGSGKSVTNLAVLGLIPQPPGKIVSGSIRFRGQELLHMSQRDLSTIRGRKIAMIFQDPMTALNPLLTIEDQLTEVTRIHLGHDRQSARNHAISMLQKVGIPSPERRLGDYPHQFSGGMRQRVMIAMALSCKPDVLIADEPTTALDVTIQAQILRLMKELQNSAQTAIVLITHDMGVIASACDTVVVMYAGKIVEQADAVTLFRNPRHPYTLGLLKSMTRLDAPLGTRLTPIEGQPPDLTQLGKGCSFCARCRYAVEHCREETPELTKVSSEGLAACFVDWTADSAGGEGP